MKTILSITDMIRNSSKAMTGISQGVPPDMVDPQSISSTCWTPYKVCMMNVMRGPDAITADFVNLFHELQTWSALFHDWRV